jgi:hypothetical protein
LVLEAEEVDFGQFLAVWPVPPQNRQRLLSKRHCRSSWVSLPSLPKLSVMDTEFPEDDAGLAGLLLFDLFLFLDWLDWLLLDARVLPLSSDLLFLLSDLS